MAEYCHHVGGVPFVDCRISADPAYALRNIQPYTHGLGDSTGDSRNHNACAGTGKVDGKARLVRGDNLNHSLT